MAFVPAPQATLVELIFSWNGQRVENTIWVTAPGTPTAPGLATLAGSIASWWSTEIAPELSNEISLIQVDATYKGLEAGPQAIVTAGLPVPGGIPSASVNNGSAFVVKFGTASIGRSYRGRNYVPGLPRASYVSSLLQTAAANAILGGYNALPAALDANGWSHIVVSYRNNNVARTEAVSTLVTSYTATTVASRSQRRRNPGIGS